MPHPVVLAETTLQSSVPVCSLIWNDVNEMLHNIYQVVYRFDGRFVH